MRRRAVLVAVSLALAAGAVWLALPPSELERLRADLDATDPGWRFDDLRAARVADQPPPAENVVHIMTAAARLIPPEFGEWVKTERGSKLTRQTRPKIDPAGVAAWRAADEAVAAARRAAGRPNGTTEIDPPGDPFQYPSMGYILDAQQVAFLLQADALFAGRCGDPAGALASVRAILAVARGVGRDPFLNRFDTTHALQGLAVIALQRALAVAEPAAGDLPAVAADLRAAGEPGAFVKHLRGWRAVEDLKLSAVAVGRVHIDAAGVLRSLGRYDTPNLVGRLDYRFRSLGTDHAATLAHLNRLVQIAGRPPEEWSPAVAAVPYPPDDIRHRYTWAVVSYAGQKFRIALHRLALLRAAGVAVACERFRLEHGRWPDALAELPATETADPYTGRPLVLKRLPDGLLVYSVGPDGRDDGGRVFDPALFIGPIEGGLDVGFRLWDVAARRQPAAEGNP